jgi:hypothetical protein
MGLPKGAWARFDMLIRTAELRGLNSRCSDGAQVRRILALAIVLEGRPRRQAADLNGMDRQTLRDGAHRYTLWAWKA